MILTFEAVANENICLTSSLALKYINKIIMKSDNESTACTIFYYNLRDLNSLMQNALNVKILNQSYLMCTLHLQCSKNNNL